jgi:hypothetical protein
VAAEVDVNPPTPRGLLVDWGGVLTTDVFVSFQQFCRNEGLDQTLVRDLFRSDPEGRRTLFALETGELTEPEFEGGSPRSWGCARTARPA